VNIGIGNNRWIRFVRAPDGEWHGRGHGYRFSVGRLQTHHYGEQWRCRVYVATGGPQIAGCLSAKMKAAIQEGTRRADEKVALTPTPPEGDTCPT
jgi:hypothetical protein